ncbi:YggT family protein [Saccharibacillus kuerlensis]|uniref:Cell division protein n=1 Tax=Saccharibacillus kuerlensis TaxID=459527 RepID=A0ABQ2KZQ7_9BACL|nr:YggT family protein [Saccharibacillus kuerlensis]GGN96453.1 cell division protein [Saccharibacillus kuerlensis]
MVEFLLRLEYQWIPLLFQIYSWLLIIYILMSWLPNVRESQVGVMLGKVVEPYLSIFRRFIPPIGGMLDISPIVAFFVLRFVQRGVMYLVELLRLAIT